MRALPLFAALPVALALAPAMAAPEITAEGADEIRLGIKSYVARAAGSEAEGYLSIGQVSVTPGSDGYDATIPDIMVVTDEGDVITVGDIVLDIGPRDDGWYDLSWILPDTIPIQLAGEPPMALTFGDQRGSAVVVPSIGNFLAMDAALTDVAITSETDGEIVRMRSLSMDGDYEETSPDIYDQFATVRASGLSVQLPGRTELIALADLTLDVEYKGMSVRRMGAIAQIYREILADIPANPSRSGDVVTDAERTAMGQILRDLPSAIAGAAMSYAVSGLVIDVEGAPMTVADTILAMAATDLNSDRSTLSMTLDVGDTGGMMPPGTPAGLAPTQSRLDLRLSDLPTQTLFDGLADAIEDSVGNDPAVVMPMLGLMLHEAMMEAGSELAIDRVLVVNGTSRFDATGVVRPDQAAAFGVTADVTILFTGMDALIETFQGMWPDDEETVQVLTLFSALGAESTDAAGNPARRYDIVVLPSGRATLNGTDMAPLLGMLP
ncbi:MAG: hypothetical protein ACTS3R_01295 [Inquilinaceae bacterium]